VGITVGYKVGSSDDDDGDNDKEGCLLFNLLGVKNSGDNKFGGS
jgi:hypothetical protein